MQTLTFTAMNLNRLEQTSYILQTVVLRTNSSTADNRVDGPTELPR